MSRSKKLFLGFIAALAGAQVTVYIDWYLMYVWPLYHFMDAMERLTPLIVIGAEG